MHPLMLQRAIRRVLRAHNFKAKYEAGGVVFLALVSGILILPSSWLQIPWLMLVFAVFQIAL